MEQTVITQIEAVLEPVIEVLGYKLWGLELLGEGHHKILRVYIDSETGVNLDDCAKVSSQVSGILDVEDIISSSYDLEVSSPGLDRPLFKAAQFQQFIGRDIRIKLQQPIQGQRNYIGEINDVEADSVVLLVDAEKITIALNDIDKAKLIPEL